MALPATEQRIKTQADLDAEALLQRAHYQATHAGIAEMAGAMQLLLGQQVTAYITRAADPKSVGKWARGERIPRADSARRLRQAYHVATLLTMAEDEQTTQSWFLGMNPFLRDRAPAYVIREFPDGGEQAMDAVRAFISYG